MCVQEFCDVLLHDNVFCDCGHRELHRLGLGEKRIRLLAAAAATDRLVIEERTTTQGALQPRLVPLRVHEGGVHQPVQKLLVDQDAVDVLEQSAVDVLHCGSTEKTAVWTRR